MNPKPARSSTTVLSFVERHQGLLVVLVAAFAVRISGLGEWWLNPDEGIYYSILTRVSFGGFWDEVATNAHPPLYYLLLRGLGLLTWDFSWFRGFTLVCGLGAVWAIWAVARSLAGLGARGTVAGLVAAVAVAFAPGAIELSQVIRPYMLQAALLGGALFFLLRYLEEARGSDGARAAAEPTRPDSFRSEGAGRNLPAYVALILLALLTHYSSVLALAAFGLVVLHDGFAHGHQRRAWRRLLAMHLIPGVLLGLVYLVHLRPLMNSALADEALDGWLSPYMIDSPGDAWLGFLGFQHILAHPWLRGLTAVLALAALVVSALSRPDDRESGPDPRRPAAVMGAGLVVAALAAALGAYPFGSTRHSAWLLVFIVPGLGWIVAYALSRTGRAALLWGGALLVLLAASGPVSDALGGQSAPWAPTDRVLRQSNLAQLADIIGPEGSPELIVVSAQTFYLLLPLYPAEREGATWSEDGRLFHFDFGARRVLVSQSWDFSAGPDPKARSHLAGTLSEAIRAFPDLGIQDMEQAVLLVGGWRPALVDELAAASEREPFIISQRTVPGMFAYLLDLPPLMDVFGTSPFDRPVEPAP